MAAATKNDLIESAYSYLRISGITVAPIPEDISLALGRLEDMMAELEGRGLCINYAFEVDPLPTTESGVNKKHKNMIASNLAIRTAIDFGKDVPIQLSKIASGSYRSSSAMVAKERMREVAYPQRHPRGSGNRRFNRWRRFYPADHPPKTSCANDRLFIGDVADYSEFFAAFLEGETIASHTIDSTSGLQISNDVVVAEQLNYRVTAIGGSSGQNATDQTIVITITTSTGRITTRERLITLEQRAIA